MRPPQLTLLALALSLSSACSLGVTPRDACTSTSECQTAFGFGSTCGADGLCARATMPPRCTTAFPTDLLTAPERYPNMIVFGNLMDRSVSSQAARELSAQLAYRQANDADGVEGRQFGAVFCDIREDAAIDTLTRPEAALETATFLANVLQVPAILGPSGSADVQSVFTEIRSRGVIVISPSATSTSLTDIDVTAPTDDAPGLLWRTCGTDGFQGSVIADDMEERGVTNVAVIHVSGVYGDGLAAEFMTAFSGTATPFRFENETQRETAVNTVGEGAAFEEVLVIASQPADAVSVMVGTLALTGYDTKEFFLTDGAGNVDFLRDTAAGGATRRYPQIRGTRASYGTGSPFSLFTSSYRSAFSDDVTQYSFAAHAYDAAWLLIYGAAWALLQEGGELSGETIARGLRRLSSGMAFNVGPTNLQGVVNAFRGGSGVDLTGASGRLEYDPATEETRGGIDVWTIGGAPAAIVVERTVEP